MTAREVLAAILTRCNCCFDQDEHRTCIRHKGHQGGHTDLAGYADELDARDCDLADAEGVR